MSIRQFLARLMRDESAMSAVEYGLICGLIVITMVTALAGFAGAIKATWTNTSTQTEIAVGQATAH